MHTEEIRVRLAARRFRAELPVNNLTGAEDLLVAAEVITGVSRSYLPADDPLLAGAHAVLDRGFQTIWVNTDRPRANQVADAAHEFGHLVLHGSAHDLSSEQFVESVSGYSRNQRDEVDAHRFAAELLLPLNVAKDLFLAGRSASSIGSQLQLPRLLVVRQLTLAFADTCDLSSEAGHVDELTLDSWQRDAMVCDPPALIVGMAGTGKSTSLVARCRYLVVSKGAVASKILIAAESRRSAELIRGLLTHSQHVECALVPVTTPFQFAYDLLVRFPALAGLPEGWEESSTEADGVDHLKPEQFPALAIKLLRVYAEVREAVGDRYQHLLIDNFDLLTGSAQALMLEVVSAVGSGLWATSAEEMPVMVPRSSLGAGTKVLSRNTCHLAFQHRSAPAIDRFVNLSNLAGEKRPVNRRRGGGRCDDGTVTIAVAETRDQLVDGIARFVVEKRQQGYEPKEILLLADSISSSSAAYLAKIVERLTALGDAQKSDASDGDLLAILDLCLGNHGGNAKLRGGQIAQYKRSPGLLEAHIRTCKSCRTPKEALETYLFEVSDYLRNSPLSGPAAHRMLIALSTTEMSVLAKRNFSFIASDLASNMSSHGDARQGSTEFEIDSSGLVARRSAPIVIVTDAKTAGLGEKNSTESKEATVEEDHLLFCIRVINVSNELTDISRLVSGVQGVTVVDWRSDPLDLCKTNSAKDRLPVKLSRADEILFRQCPRRVYYKNIVDRQTTGKAPLGTNDVKDFPATPVDLGLCRACAYVDICPAELV